MKEQQILEIAREFESMNSSSALCYEDALRQFYKDNFDSAIFWALRSLEHSVGIFHPKYQAAKAISLNLK